MRFETLEEAQAYLDRWDARWAHTRIHGTTKRQVAAMFAKEQPALGPLPLEPFRYYRFGVRTVHLDGVEIEAAYYGAPPGWIGRRVDLQWNDLFVRLLDPTTGQLLREHVLWRPRALSRNARTCSFSGRPAPAKSSRPGDRAGGYPTGLPRHRREAHTLLEELAEATLAGTRKDYLADLATVPLRIVDDLGMRKLAHAAAEDLLELIMQRYERASTLLTSNRPVDDWASCLATPPPSPRCSIACCITRTCSNVGRAAGGRSCKQICAPRRGRSRTQDVIVGAHGTESPALPFGSGRGDCRRRDSDQIRSDQPNGLEARCTV